jgi:hypothetical protein
MNYALEDVSCHRYRSREPDRRRRGANGSIRPGASGPLRLHRRVDEIDRNAVDEIDSNAEAFLKAIVAP